MSFFITAIADYPEKEEYSKPHRVNRTFGHYGYLSDAMRAADNNTGSMAECLYNFLVIEEIEFGIHALTKTEFWYIFDLDKNQWVKTMKPEWSKGITNWAIG